MRMAGGGGRGPERAGVVAADATVLASEDAVGAVKGLLRAAARAGEGVYVDWSGLVGDGGGSDSRRRGEGRFGLVSMPHVRRNEAAVGRIKARLGAPLSVPSQETTAERGDKRGERGGEGEVEGGASVAGEVRARGIEDGVEGGDEREDEDDEEAARDGGGRSPLGAARAARREEEIVMEVERLGLPVLLGASAAAFLEAGTGTWRREEDGIGVGDEAGEAGFLTVVVIFGIFFSTGEGGERSRSGMSRSGMSDRGSS